MKVVVGSISLIFALTMVSIAGPAQSKGVHWQNVVRPDTR